MLYRLFLWTLKNLAKGPGRSWLFSTLAIALLRFVKSQTGRREYIDVSKVKPGDSFTVKHLDTTHQELNKQTRATKKADKRAKRQARKTVS